MLPLLIGAILMAKQVGVSDRLIDATGTLYVLGRILYIFLYVTGETGVRATARSSVWLVLFSMLVALMGYSAYVERSK